MKTILPLIVIAALLCNCGTNGTFTPNPTPLDSPGGYTDYNDPFVRAEMTAQLHRENIRLITNNKGYDVSLELMQTWAKNNP